MPLSFPSSPTVGQQSTQNGRTYAWSGSAWEFVGNVVAHKDRHAIGGADALSPADIGAVPSAGGTLTGALTHAATQTFVSAGGSAASPAYSFTGDTNTGIFSSAADTLGLSTGGVRRMQIDADGNVGIGNNAVSNTRLISAQTLTNATGFGMQCNTHAVASANGAYATFGLQVNVNHNIPTGVANSSVSRAMLVTCARNNGFPTDAGSLGFVRGMEFQYGHGNGNAAITPTTTQVIGLQMVPLVGPGTITDLYDIYIGSTTHNTGTLGNHFSIFQAQATAKNYFAGSVGCNTTTPATALEVNGVITVGPGAVGACSIVSTLGTADTGIYFPTTDVLAVATAGANRIYCAANGRVGIGASTTPQAMLGVNGANNYGTDFLSVGNSAVAYPTPQWSGQAGFVSKGTICDGRMLQQDGNGRLNTYWNAYSDATSGTNQKYQVSGEPAARILTSNASTTGAVHAWYGAPSGTAGATITWQQLGQMQSGTGGFTWFSPRGTSSDFYITSAGNVGIGTTTPTTPLDVNGSTLRLRTARTPSSTGEVGEVCWDADYVWICTATNTWRRVAHSVSGASGGAVSSVNGQTGEVTVQKTITSGTAVPTGGSSGDIYLRYA
jgi:hypothetical protein